MAQSSLRLNIGIAIVVVLAISIVGANEYGFFGVLTVSFGFAAMLNGLVGAALGFVAGAMKWSTSGDPADQVAMFGAKIGVYVFATLMLISVVLLYLKQPPTRAPVVAVAVPWYGLELAGCILEPISWIWEIGEFTKDSRKKHFNRRNPNDRR